jgi:hypothetical protein
MGETAPQAARGKTPDERALEALRWNWGEAYLIGWDVVRDWWANRRDGLGGDITAAGPDELRAAILADYTLKPVPRAAAFPAGSAGGDDDLLPGRVLRDSDDDEPS